MVSVRRPPGSARVNEDRPTIVTRHALRTSTCDGTRGPIIFTDSEMEAQHQHQQ
jgi:hypothetical protein